jgi:hypothetical protein
MAMKASGMVEVLMRIISTSEGLMLTLSKSSNNSLGIEMNCLDSESISLQTKKVVHLTSGSMMTMTFSAVDLEAMD